MSQKQPSDSILAQRPQFFEIQRTATHAEHRCSVYIAQERLIEPIFFKEERRLAQRASITVPNVFNRTYCALPGSTIALPI